MSDKKKRNFRSPLFFSWAMGDRQSQLAKSTRPPPKHHFYLNGCRWRCIRVQNPCYDERLAERRPNPPNPYNCVPFHTPIPGRADPEPARQGEAKAHRRASTRIPDVRSSEGSRGDRLVRWREETNHLSTFFFFFFLCVPAAASALACRLRTTVVTPKNKTVNNERVRSNRGRLLLSYLNRDDC